MKNKIGDIGAKYIGLGLSKLIKLTYLFLNVILYLRNWKWNKYFILIIIMI